MIGKTISHYKILENIGSGGMGVVYKADDLKLKRQVALKFLPLAFSSDPEIKERFMHEAQAASALQHANICAIHDIDETEDGQMFIVMDFYEGETLKSKIEWGEIKVEEAIDYAIQIAEGLQEAHQKGIIHRDIKPANVIITNKGEVKILDFGLAKLIGQTKITKSGTTVGTVAYMSPEQARGDEVDHRTDIWSLGVILYEMLSGELPFKGDYEQAIIYAICNESPRILKGVKADISQNMNDLVGRALSKNPESRYLRVDDLIIDLNDCQKNIQTAEYGNGDKKSPLAKLRKPIVALPLFLILILIAIGLYLWNSHNQNILWVRETAIPEIENYVDRAEYMKAYLIATQARQFLPNDSTLIKLWPEFTWVISIQTNPPDADVYMKKYAAMDADWEYLGITPIDSLIVPRGFKQWKIEKEGYITAETAGGPAQWSGTNDTEDYKFSLTLDKIGSIPKGMVRIPGEQSRVGELDDFFMDKYEVTNRQYKEFVTNGGYQKEDYWTYPFIKNGQQITWDQAMSEFVDKTGRSGPATWEAGDYPDGKENYPVNGISWYEAAAFAEFSGKELPTIYHWILAAARSTSGSGSFRPSEIIPASNYNNQGPAAVGSSPGISQFGCYDMAGNVREWCWNETQEGRTIRGGAWNDVLYMFFANSQQSPLNRSPKNGFRCVTYIDKEKIPPDTFEPIPKYKAPDYYNMKEVSEEIFQTYKDQYQYDPISLDPIVEERDESEEDWIKERVTFKTVYDRERMIAFLFLPKNSIPPFQTVIYFPGAGAWWESYRNILQLGAIDFIVKDGRAVVYPIYLGSHMRQLTNNESGSGIYELKDRYIKRIKDFRRTIDYLETRSDIDTLKIGYYGYSFGAAHGLMIPAVEERVNLAILYLGGIPNFPLPEIAPVNYLTRIKIPVLMLNGKYDTEFDLQSMVYPMRDLLGTPKKDKKLLVYETDHFIPRNERIKESLNWLDKYFGPVQRK